MQDLKTITIAIDGFSSTGKSTVAKQFAHQLKYVYVDSGAMYRAVTYFAMQKQLITESIFEIEKLVQQLKHVKLEFNYNDELGFAEIYLNGVNIENEIRTLEVSNFVSKVAEVSEIRKKLVEQQQEMGFHKGVVMDGRDIGTVVFPNAELKIFMTASAEKRARRRFDELVQRGDFVTYEDILKNVRYRDHIDSTRSDSPLVKASDAIEIDNSDLTLEGQFEKLYDLALEKITSV